MQKIASKPSLIFDDRSDKRLQIKVDRFPHIFDLSDSFAIDDFVQQLAKVGKVAPRWLDNPAVLKRLGRKILELAYGAVNYSGRDIKLEKTDFVLRQNFALDRITAAQKAIEKALKYDLLYAPSETAEQEALTIEACQVVQAALERQRLAREQQRDTVKALIKPGEDVEEWKDRFVEVGLCGWINISGRDRLPSAGKPLFLTFLDAIWSDISDLKEISWINSLIRVREKFPKEKAQHIANLKGHYINFIFTESTFMSLFRLENM